MNYKRFMKMGYVLWVLMIVCFKKKKISSFYYYSMSSQGKRIVVLDLTAFPFLQTLNKEKTVNYSCKSLFL